jgi:branched-subunit amino acid ABC-type transport system permease component
MHHWRCGGNRAREECVFELIEYLTRGALIGVTYGLLAFPVSLLFSTTGSVDVALGAYAVLAAAIMYAVGGPLGVLAAIGVAVLASAIVGVISMRLNRPGHVDHVIAVLGTFGLAIFVESFILTMFGTSPMIRQPFSSFWDIGGIRISPQMGINLFVCIAILSVLFVVLQKTPFGRAMRASAVNPVGAALNGIPVKQIWFSTYVLGGLLAGVAGVLILFTTGADYSTSFTLTIWGFGAAIIFGMRSPLRGFAGGLIIGVIQALCAGYLPGGMATAMPFVFIFVVLSLGRMNQIAATGGRV